MVSIVAARRRAPMAAMHHPTVLRGADGDPAARLPGLPLTAPTLLQLNLEDSTPRFLARASDPLSYRQLLAEEPPLRGDDGSWTLHPPLHRIAHLVLVEAGCAAPGEPPVDVRRIRSAGVVIRRVVNGVEERWVRRGGAVVGWVAHPQAADDDLDAYEPDPARRAKRMADPAWRPLLLAGALADDGLEEDNSPCFPAPPAVRSASCRTLLYGNVPTSSSEQAPPDPQPPFDAEFITAAIPAWLRELPKTPPPPLPYTIAPSDDPATWSADVRQFRRDLAWLLQGTGAGAVAGDNGHTPAGAMLRTLLATLTVGYDDDGDGTIDREEPLTALLDRAAPVLLERRADAAAVRLPDAWPTIANDQALRNVIIACFTSRWRAMTPGIGRFEDPAARYVVRVFVRMADECGCPERIRWSRPTALCTILPWYGNSPRPPARIPLPDLDGLSQLKPNVAFAIPPKLRGALDAMDLGDMIDGKKGSPFGEWGMICSFSLPIITLCAFIVLNIFLGLLNIVFSWMMWVKICIPYPKKL